MKASVTTGMGENYSSFDLNGPEHKQADEEIKAAMADGLIAAVKPSIKARVISISRDYLTLEFEPGQQIDFQQGQVVSVSK